MTLTISDLSHSCKETMEKNIHFVENWQFETSFNAIFVRIYFLHSPQVSAKKELALNHWECQS